MPDILAAGGLGHAIFRLAPLALWLALLWLAESLFSKPREGRLRHGLMNISLGAINGLLLFFPVGYLSIVVCSFSAHASASMNSLVPGLLGLDLFGYFWHRANHRFPYLWRFHAIHHSDNTMNVTTSGRFHSIELGLAGLASLPVLFLLQISPEVLLVYETTLVAVSMLHHSTINLGQWDWALSLLIVTPRVHSIHHSRDPNHLEYNFSSVLSFWDRLFRTFHLSNSPISHGLEGFDNSTVRTFKALLAAPFKREESPGKGDPSLGRALPNERGEIRGHLPDPEPDSNYSWEVVGKATLNEMAASHKSIHHLNLPIQWQDLFSELSEAVINQE